MNGSEEDPGIIPIGVKDVFRTIEMVCDSTCFLARFSFFFWWGKKIKNCFVFFCFLLGKQTADREFLIRVSYMEIYNEEINDLLSLGNQKLPVHESLEVRVAA